MVDLVRQMSALLADGVELLLVSSGAIATGREILDLSHLPKDIPAKQMLSAVGQPRLMDRWVNLFDIYDQTVAQVLLTRDDLRVRSRYLNARNTLMALLQNGILPVVNENDTVATEEIRVGDNDNLSALVSNLVDADLLTLLTDQEGLYAADPRLYPDAMLVERVDTPEIDASLWQAAGGSGRMGVGGMVTKLQAADLARRSGAAVVIARGDARDVLLRIVDGERLGTRFEPTSTALESRKRFILAGERTGRLAVDQGAALALQEGSSLLPVGMVDVSGDFARGETVGVWDPQGREVACGLVNYKAADCARLCGLQSHQIEAELGYFYGDEVIHRNNLVLL
jgi:glutamate 5-kinase